MMRVYVNTLADGDLYVSNNVINNQSHLRNKIK